jgi:hypothetical protein
MPLKRQKAANGKCKAKTEAGHQWASSPERQRLLRGFTRTPNRAAELGRKGGARNRILQAPSETAPNLHQMLESAELSA